MTHNYRIAFDYAAETPREAVSHLLGLIDDPELQDKPFDWVVTDQDSGEEHHVRCTFNEIEREALQHIREFISGGAQ